MIELATEITEVVVYTDRARVTRHSDISLEPGIQSLEIPDLTSLLNPDSVRASAKGTATARLLGVKVQRVFYEETVTEQVHELEEKIETYQDELKALEVKEERIKQTQDSLSTLAEQTDTYALALASGEQSIEEQLSLFDKLRNRVIKFDRDLIKNTKDRREKERQLDKVRKEIERWYGTPHRETYTAIIELEVDSAGEFNLDLSYVVSGVGWQPLYDLHFSEDSNPNSLEINYLAQVSQNTGENWQDVVLSLSTARPAQTSILPELEPWFIRPLTSRVPTARSAAAPLKGRLESAPPPDLVMEAEEVQVAADLAAVESSGTNVTYRIPSTVTILADGSPHKTTVAIFSLPTDLDYACAPKLTEAVYRQLHTVNESPYTLLSGPANLFADEEFIGSIKMELTPPRGKVELYLGVEDRLKVEREFIRRDVDKRIVGGRRRILLGYEIKVENLFSHQIDLAIHDQMPLSRSEDVKVKLEFADPKPSTQEDMNMLTWELTMKASENRTIRFVFGVEHPQGMQILGLP